MSTETSNPTQSIITPPGSPFHPSASPIGFGSPTSPIPSGDLKQENSRALISPFTEELNRLYKELGEVKQTLQELQEKFNKIKDQQSIPAHNLQKQIAQKEKVKASIDKYIFLLGTVIPKSPFRPMYEVLLSTSANLNELLLQARGQERVELEEQVVLVQELIEIIDEGLKIRHFHSNEEVQKRVTNDAIHMALFSAVKFQVKYEELSKQPPLQKLFKIINTLSKSIAERSRHDIQKAEDEAGELAQEIAQESASVSLNKHEFDTEAKSGKGILKKRADAKNGKKTKLSLDKNAMKSIVRVEYSTGDDFIPNFQTRLLAYAELYKVFANAKILDDAVKERECLFIGAGVKRPDGAIATKAVPVGVQTLRDIGAIDAADNIHNEEDSFDWINVKTIKDLSAEPKAIGFVREEIIAHMKSLGFEGTSPEKIVHMLALDAAICKAASVVAKKLGDQGLEIFLEEMPWFFSSVYKTMDSIFTPGSFKITPEFSSRLVLEIRQSKTQLIEQLQEYINGLQSEFMEFSTSLKTLDKRISDYEASMFAVLGELAEDDTTYDQFLDDRQQLVNQIHQLKILIKPAKETLLATKKIAPEISDTMTPIVCSDSKSGPAAPLLLPPVTSAISAVTQVSSIAVIEASASAPSCSPSAVASSSAFFATPASLKPTKSVVSKGNSSVQPTIESESDVDLESINTQFSAFGCGDI